MIFFVLIFPKFKLNQINKRINITSTHYTKIKDLLGKCGFNFKKKKGGGTSNIPRYSKSNS